MPANLSKIRFSPQASMRQQLSHQLREMIVSGEMSEGDRLPSNQELAEKWNVAASSVQAAMSSLTKEGLLQRARKRGTFVAKRPRTLTQVAIYLADDIWHMREAAFRRAVVASISAKLRTRKIVPAIWSDTRAESIQSEPWPALVRAADQRQIQAILMCSGSPAQSAWLSRLPVPLAALTTRRDRNCVGVDHAHGERLALQELIRKGCRSVGIITPVSFPSYVDDVVATGGVAQSVRSFRQHAKEFGLEIREEWVRVPAAGVVIEEAKAERFGYEQMKKVLALPRRPDGLFITYDWVARGAIMAVLESRDKLAQLKLVLHRNVEVGMLCPIEASFLDFSVGEVASGMISIMDAQLRGEESENVRVHPKIATI